MKRRTEEDRTVTYVGPDGKEHPGYVVDGHVYTDPEGTVQMPVGSSFTAADGQLWDMTAQGGVPAGQGGSQVWLARLQALWQELSSRTGPTYDPAEDPLWQRYVQTYQGLGRQAMEDAQGRAAALTGGYGSSYAKVQGSQAYDQYLQKLWDQLPALYGQAGEAYDRETEDLYDRFVQLRALYEDALKGEQTAAAATAPQRLSAAQLKELLQRYRKGDTVGLQDLLDVYERLGYDLSPYYDVTGGSR